MQDSIIEKLLNTLDLGKLINKPTRVYGGLLNRMYKVTTNKGVYAIKHLNSEVMKRKDAKNNHIIAEEIANIAKEKGINAAPAKIFKNGALQEVDRNYFFVYDWFEGNIIQYSNINEYYVKTVAENLAKIHKTDFSEIINKCKHENEISETDWEFYISKLKDEETKQILINNIDKLIRLDNKATKFANEIKNNIVLSHRDLDVSNILWNKDNIPIIIDWESAGLVNPCEEVVETAWDWSGGNDYFDINKFKLFLTTYEKFGGNLKDFNKAIYSNFKNKSGWLEFNLKRVSGIECQDEEEYELGIKIVKSLIEEILNYYNTVENLKI